MGRPPKPTESLIGHTNGFLTVVEGTILTPGGWHWKCECRCGNVVFLRDSSVRKGKRSSCGCRTTGALNARWRGCGDVSGHYWYCVREGAESRGIPITATLEDAWEVFKAQNGKCALTGWDIELKPSKHKRDMTASLDRIDSNKGYAPGNLQWVHKDVNRMKNAFGQSYFIEVCRAVSLQHPFLAE